jgi:predicted DNA-binding transcriptional regulator AlpA
VTDLTYDETVDRFVGLTEAATVLHLSKAKVYALVAAGEFPVPVVLIGGCKRVSLRRLVEFINQAA